MNSTDFSPRQIEIMEAAISLIDTKGIQELTIKNLSHDVGVTEAVQYCCQKLCIPICNFLRIVTYRLQHF